MSTKSFASILKERIEQKDQHRPSQSYDPAYLSFLMGQISQTRVHSPHSVKSYRKMASAPNNQSKGGPESPRQDTPPIDHSRTGESSHTQTAPSRQTPPPTQAETPKPRPVHSMSPTQEEAYCRFVSRGALLERGFFKSELKLAYRRLARELHPDTCKHSRDKNGLAFVEIKQAFDELSKLFIEPNRPGTSKGTSS